MSGFQEFSFGQGDGGLTGRTKRFKAEAGSTYRISFVWFDGLMDGKLNFGTPEAPAAPKFLGAQVHYIAGAGYIINKGPEYTALAGDAPRARIGTVIIVWPTDKNGKLDKARLANNEDEVVRWIFSSDKYRSLQQIHDEFPLSQHDVTLSCTDSGFQKMTFTPCKESLLKTLSGNPAAAEHVARLISQAAQVATDIQSDIGQDMTISQIQEKLAGAGITTTASAPAGSSVAASSGDIDDYVDGLLDA